MCHFLLKIMNEEETRNLEQMRLEIVYKCVKYSLPEARNKLSGRCLIAEQIMEFPLTRSNSRQDVSMCQH